MDERFEVWRGNGTGAVIAGNPLCGPKQYTNVIEAFLGWLKKTIHLKPIFVLCGQEVEEVLGTEFGWKSLSCSTEQRFDLTHDGHVTDKDVERKIRHAKAAGVKVIDLGSSVPTEIQERCYARIKGWQENRKGTPVHLSKITPWKDMAHRHYLYAEDKEGKICALAVLAQIAPRYGVQVKWALDFPIAPNGAIEYVTPGGYGRRKSGWK
jgi:ergosteryl-3beta-O-L-aspartate synthase